MKHKNDLNTLKACSICEARRQLKKWRSRCDFIFWEIGLSAIYDALYNWERLGIRIIFKNGVVTGDDLSGIFYSPAQLKTNTPVTLLAKRKPAPC